MLQENSAILADELSYKLNITTANKEFLLKSLLTKLVFLLKLFNIYRIINHQLNK